MRVRAALATGAVLALVASLIVIMVESVDGGHPSRAAEPAPAAPPLASFVVRHGRLYDANGVDLVMRGAGHMHTLYPDQTAGAIAAMKVLGANTVRIELSTGAVFARNTAADVANVIAMCKRSRLICVLEVHDTTGYGARTGAITQAQAADYWLSIRGVLMGQERYVILEVANEPYAIDNHSLWPSETSAAIGRLRAAGLRHTLMVDAPDWGQDMSLTMRDNAAAVLRKDPASNLIFSIHMYGAFTTATKVWGYVAWFVNAGLPIVIGEFGYLHSDGDPDEDAMMSVAQSYGVGYLGWSWSGNGGGLEYLDMVSGFNLNALTGWGQRIFNGPNGIRTTAREASVYR